MPIFVCRPSTRSSQQQDSEKAPGVNAETKIANKQEVGKKDCEKKTVNEENEEKAVTRDIEEKRTGVTKDQEAGSISKVTDCNAQKDR